MDAFSESFTYVKAIISDLQVASLAPSSSHVAQQVCANYDFFGAQTVVELGAGEGAVTKYILDQMGSTGSLYAFELNHGLATLLKERIRDRRLKVIYDDAENLSELCELRDIRPDIVVAGIPFSFFSYEKTVTIFKGIAHSLKPNGCVILYQTWLPPFFQATKTREVMSMFFDETAHTLVYKNLPPLIIIKAVLNSNAHS